MVTPSAQSDDPNTSSPDIEAGAASISFRRRLMRWFRRLVVVVAIFMVVGLAWLASLWHHHPPPIERLANWPTSPKIEDAEGRVLLERIGIDEQWRHPIGLDAMSPWLIQATLAVEDRRFHSHIGIDPAAVVRAAVQNATSARVISGASTLSMQLCRMLDDKPRTLRSKIIESLQAVRIERAMTKDEILAAYLNIAPYGGNLRGVEAASRFWFSKPAADLALHEAALLAGLPQSPVRLNPARHPDRAVARRNLVLRRMHEEGMISAATLDEARSMPLELRIGRRNALTAPSMAWLALARRPDGGTIHLDRELQAQCQRLADHAAAQLPADSDLAVVVIDIQRGQLAAMIGTVRPFDPRTGQVNSALGWRSPGSALKPFAYALAFEHRRLNAASTVDDRPMTLAGWRPENFDRTFSGQVTIAEALQRSLNLPAVRITEQMGLAGVVGMMEACGVQLFDDAARRGGLATVLGAVEVRLLDLTNAYATIGRGGLRRAPALFTDESDAPVRVLSEITCAELDDILGSHRVRPAGMHDLVESDVPWFMWKTGTSSGRRDAWAVGHNQRYAIGVWAGRVRGSGDGSLIGRHAAEPLLARLFDLPEVRNGTPPRLDAPRPVLHPLPLADDDAQRPPRILSPAHGTRYPAINGRAIVHGQAEAAGPVLWLINGQPASRRNPMRQELPPGRYEVRLVDAAGRAATSIIHIMPPP